jgi:uncharacterized membrane protein
MTAAKLIAVAFGLLLVLFLGGLFGSGPPALGLGPPFDQIVTVTAVVLAVISASWLLRAFRKMELSARSKSGIPQAEEILRGRYARGELDRNQFLLMLEDVRTETSHKE